MSPDITELLSRFEGNLIAPGEFGHEDHVHVAFAMLQKYEFTEACMRYARTIKSMADRAGAADKFNTTITVAFMSLISERCATQANASYDEFIVKNADLLDRNVLSPWYSKERLGSALARRQFLLPQVKVS